MMMMNVNNVVQLKILTGGYLGIPGNVVLHRSIGTSASYSVGYHGFGVEHPTRVPRAPISVPRSDNRVHRHRRTLKF